MKRVHIIGAGLAGSEAAYQLSKRGFKVILYEMRPKTQTPAHHTGAFAELVCSNSFRGDALTQGAGMMKRELRLLDSLIIKTADQHQVPAGTALAVDREHFSKSITQTLKNDANITIVNQEVTTIPSEPCIITTGPLTSFNLLKTIQQELGSTLLNFYDAAAPIISSDSIDTSICYKKSRYQDAEGDYYNCPMDKETYHTFYNALITAKCTEVKAFEMNVFEGCMPIETMAKRGVKTLLFGPLKPVGLEKDANHKPYAVVQLRQDDQRASMYNIVGFQTHLTFNEQQRIIRMIPGLQNANILRYGLMHKNSFINAPKLLDTTYRVKQKEYLYIAGQLSGVEGYIESTASGLLAAISLARQLEGKACVPFPKETMIGAQADYIANASSKHFQPMNANFGLLDTLHVNVEKKQKKRYLAERGITAMKGFIDGTLQ